VEKGVKKQTARLELATLNSGGTMKSPWPTSPSFDFLSVWGILEKELKFFLSSILFPHSCSSAAYSKKKLQKEAI
jgi:hypothetical protein